MASNQIKPDETYISDPIQSLKIAVKRLLQTNLQTLIIMIALSFGVAVVAMLLAIMGALAPQTPSILLVSLVVITALAVSVVLQVAITYILVRSQALETVTAAQALRRGLARFWVAIGTNILAVLMTLGGLVLFIIPGIYIALRLSYVQSVVADEDTGPLANIKRSWHLTKNNLWDIIGSVATMTTISTAAMLLVIAIIHILVGDNISDAVWVGETLIGLVTIPLVSVFYFRYHQSRLEKQSRIVKDETAGLNYLMLPVVIIISVLYGSYSASIMPTQPGEDYLNPEFEFPTELS